MLNIKHIIGSEFAMISTQGTLLYLKMIHSTAKTITLDFEGLEACNTPFVNASIGRYMEGDNTKKISYRNCKSVWKDKIKRAIHLATNKEAKEAHNQAMQNVIEGNY